MRAEIAARARLIACTLAGAAIILFISSVKDEKHDELYYHPKIAPATLFNIKAEKIAHGLEEKNRINAEKVIVSYTHEDKILAGFQKAVKERDEKFRNEVAKAAKESKAEEAATTHYDNNGDPDDPKYKYDVAHIVMPKSEVKSKFDEVSEQKSEKVESHIDHEVAEITGENKISSTKVSSVKKELVKAKPASEKSEVEHEKSNTEEEKRPVHATENLEKYMHSPAYNKALSAAKKKAESAEKMVSDREAKSEVETHQSISEGPVKSLKKGSSLKSTEAKHAPRQNVRSTDLEKYSHQYSDHAPMDLKDYMKSPEYLKIRRAAERQSEIYFEEQQKKEASEAASASKASANDDESHPSVQAPSREGILKPESQIKTEESAGPTREGGDKHLAKAHRKLAKSSLADDDDSDEPEDAPKDEPEEEPSEPDDPTEDVPSGNVPEGEGLGEENQIRKTHKLTKEPREQVVRVEVQKKPMTQHLVDERSLIQHVKASKLQLLRHFMETKEFKEQEAAARGHSESGSRQK